MASTFSGISLAGHSLLNSQHSMYITSTNINNAGTNGYSVQTADQTLGTMGIQNNLVSGGAAATVDVRQSQTLYFNTQFWDASSDHSYWATFEQNMVGVEGRFHTLDGTGFVPMYDGFEASLLDLATSPDDIAARTMLVESSTTFCDTLNQTAENLISEQNLLNEEVQISTDQINELSKQIASLNTQIRQGKLEKQNVNALVDQQDLLIDELSTLTDIDMNTVMVRIGTDSYESVQISIGGVALVTGDVHSEIELIAEGNLLDSQPRFLPVWKDTGQPLNISGGQLKASLDSRDGDGSSNGVKGIPYYMNALDDWARDYAKAFNEGYVAEDGSLVKGHTDGYGLDGTSGYNFFTNDHFDTNTFYNQGSTIDSTYENITALNISVNPEISQNPSKFAASTSQNDPSNSDNLSNLLNMIKSNDVFGSSSARESLISITTTLGASIQFSNTKSTSTLSDLQLYTTWRLSETSVSIDEETTKLNAYQQSYNASAKVIQVWNEVIEATIGLIGG